jgi:serine/threonine-protein kinase
VSAQRWSSRSRAGIILVGLLAALAAWGWLRPSGRPGLSRQLILLWSRNLPPPLDPGATILATQAAIAPDGSAIVYVDRGQLMWKPRDVAAAVPIEGTEGGVSPFFSPDGRWIAYHTLEGRLRKVPVGGGGSVTIADDAEGEYKAGAWLDDGTIVYTDSRRFLSRVSSEGVSQKGTPLRQPGTVGVATLSPLPGSHGVLLTMCFGNCSVQSDVYVYDFSADSMRLLVRQAAGAWYAPTGHLLYTSRDGGLYAARFNPSRLALESGAVPVIENVDPTRFTLSASGSALYALDPSTQSSSDLVWVTRDGRAEPVDSTWRGRFEYPALSPDGSSLAVSLREKVTDLWIRKSDGSRQKVIAGGVANWRASWLPDGKSLTFISVRSSDSTSDDNAVYRARADGSGTVERLFRPRYGVWETEISHDGRWMVIRTDEKEGRNVLYARRMAGDTTLIPLLNQDHAGLIAVQAALSPDGRWIAFVAGDVSGTVEIYVASFPDMGSRRQVSRGGGSEPRWARSGRELFFKSGGQLMAVTVPDGPVFSPGDPRPLFPLAGFRAARNRPQYDVAPDGRFVMIREPSAAAGLVYVEQWFDELKAKVKR